MHLAPSRQEKKDIRSRKFRDVTGEMQERKRAKETDALRERKDNRWRN